MLRSSSDKMSLRTRERLGGKDQGKPGFSSRNRRGEQIHDVIGATYKRLLPKSDLGVVEDPQACMSVGRNHEERIHRRRFGLGR